MECSNSPAIGMHASDHAAPTRHISRSIKTAKWCIILATCLLAAVPYVAGYWTSSPQYQFQGAVDYVPDVQSYFMWMRSAADHAGLPPNLYHTTPEQPRFFHLLWWGLGKISRFSGLSITFLYHSAHLLGAVLFLLSLWRFVGRFFSNPRPACVAFGVCCLGSGLGWYTLIVDPSLPPILRSKPALPLVSLDLWSADVNTFYSILACPHYAIALWLLIEALDRLYRSILGGPSRLCVSGAFYTLSLGFVHVYDMFLVAPLALVFSIVWVMSERRHSASEVPRCVAALTRGASFVLAAILPVLFYAIATAQSPSLASWAKQNVLPTPGPHLYLQAFGLPGALMLSYWQACRRIRRGEPEILFLVCWVGTVFLIMYSYPLLPFAKRVAEGIQIPVVILAIRCLYDQWIPWAKTRLGASKRHGIVLAAISVGLLIPTTLFLVCNATIGTTSRQHPFFVTGDERAAFDRLNQHGDKAKGVLAPWQTANIIPRYTGMMVYVGHPHLTPDYKTRRRLAHKFLWGYMDKSAMQQFLAKNRIGYLWLGRHKSRYAGSFPFDSGLFRVWFRSGFVNVHEVTDVGRGAPVGK